MSDERLRVPKSLTEVTFWVHPEGRVVGEMFLRQQSVSHAGPETPAEVLNGEDDFLAVRRSDPEEVRFYHRSAVIRVEYTAEVEADLPGVVSLPCQLHMMDGSLIDGIVREPLAPDRARLFDYLNRKQERFLRIFPDARTACLVNKSYIIRVSAPEPAGDTGPA
ncbi:MAG TPA: hypothetical protein VKA14_04195 [Gammaproteobacteria bacterium]|nr:hypothetical protein [Gammaproteobacteria bacterium]